nr:RecName: Full=Putative uncharacterized protein C8orf31 [Homo sapiens]BAC04358.1 unnamed protein product [Homo sapiens]
MAEKPHQNSCNSVRQLFKTKQLVTHRDRGSCTHRAQGLLAARTTALQRSPLQQEIWESTTALNLPSALAPQGLTAKDAHFLGDTDPIQEGARDHAAGGPFQDRQASVAAQTLSWERGQGFSRHHGNHLLYSH